MPWLLTAEYAVTCQDRRFDIRLHEVRVSPDTKLHFPGVPNTHRGNKQRMRIKWSSLERRV